uniref:Protein kinase domain-containing protein n=1 Tax=Arcella intermedia TaxID=1963864 RepID=A0A6B2KYU7_9EUKA
MNASFGQLNKLGEGAFGMVYQTTMKRVGETSEIPVAIKELQNDLSLNLKNSESNVSEFKAFAHEVNIMSKLDHINLVKLFGIVIQPNSLWMVLELCSVGSLWDFLYGKHKNPIQEKLKFKISHNIAKGVDYLHSNCFPPIVHRDLRSPNIFMVSDNPEDNVVCKVGDFGLAQQAAPHLSEVLDTWQWMAPETFRSENIRYDHSSDIYSMSIMFSEIFAERRPFEDKLDYMISRPVVRPLEEVLEEYEDTDAFLKNGEWKINFDKSTAEGIVLEFDTLRIKIAIEENDLRPTLPTSLHPTLTKLIHTAWHKDPEQRPSSSQIVSELNSILKLHSINIEEVPIVKTSTTPNYQPKNTRIISHLEDWDYSALNERFSCLCMEENPNPKYYTFWAGSFSGKIYKFERSKDVPWTKINNSWQQVTTISVFPVIKEKVTLTHLFMHKSAPNYIWSISEAGGLFVLDTLTSKVIHQHKSMIKCYAISQDNFIFTGNLEGEIQIWAVDSLALVGTHQLLKTNQISPVYSISVLSDGHLFVGSKKIIYIFSFQIQTDGAVVLTPIQNWKAHDGPIKQLLFPNQPNLLWSCSQSQIIVWNFKIEKGKFLIEKLITDCKGHEKDVTNIIKVASLKIIPHIWTSAEDRCILVWHETGLVKLELRGPLGNSDNISMVEPGIVVSGSTDLNDHHFHFWGYSSDN